MDYSLAPWTLTWGEVDPGQHLFDVDAARKAIYAFAPAAAVPKRPEGRAGDDYVIDWSRDEGDTWTDSMTLAMVERWGQWVTGWRWARDEGDFGGGPIHSWCCSRDSITSAEESLTCVGDALVEWRLWIEELAECFEQYPLTRLADPGDRVLWERGAVHLVHAVVERTGAGDAWYRHCAQVLTWFLARWGVGAEQAQHLVGEAIGGRFDSWVEPDDGVVDDMAERLGRALAGVQHAADGF
jgi:hypothetical protein